LVQRSKRVGGFAVSGDGGGIEGRAGLALPVEVADRIGLTDALCQAWLECARGVTMTLGWSPVTWR
jgi:hypothetical protein